MAQNEYVIKQRLDTTDLEKGVLTSEAGMEKIADSAKRASEAMRAMFDTPEMEKAKESFAGVAQAVSRYQAAMSKPLPMKRELRETQMAAQELEQAYRGLSNAERASAAGQELRAKIDALISRAGTLKDTMIDVQRAVKFQASDTAQLDAIVGGVKTLASVAQVAAGAMSLLGASQEDAMKVQKNLMAVMSVVNGLQMIQNSLQKEGALVMGVSAAKTALLTAATKVKAAVTASDTLASKAAAVAQMAWNTAIAANPIGATIVVIAAAAAAVYAYANKTTEAAEKSRLLVEEMKNQSSALAENRIRIMELQKQWSELTGDDSKRAWVAANKEEFAKLGVEVNNVADAENLLVANTDKFIQSMYLRAQAAAYAALAQKKMQEAIEKRTEADNKANAPSAGDKIKGWFNVGTDFDFAASVQRQAQRGANALRGQAQRAEWQAEDYLKSQQELIEKANELEKSSGIRRKATSTTSTPKTRTTKSSKADKKAVEDEVKYSVAWYDKEIKKLEELANKTADATQFKELMAKVSQLESARDIKFGKIKLTIDKEDFATRFEKEINAGLSKLKIKPLVIPAVMTDADIAKQKADNLLDKTEGLRTAANAAASAFRSMGSAIGGSAGEMVNVAGLMAQAIATMIQGYATATAQAAAELGPWAWAAFGLAGLAQLMSMISAVKSAGAFASGGIVGGTSYTGDRKWARVNSGEMILNGQQQAALFNAINSGNLGGGEVTFHIAGRDLVGVINNHNSKYSKVR